jgi:hypothetical protein
VKNFEAERKKADALFLTSCPSNLFSSLILSTLKALISHQSLETHELHLNMNGLSDLNQFRKDGGDFNEKAF